MGRCTTAADLQSNWNTGPTPEPQRFGLGMGRTSAVLVSSVTFAVGHGYEGSSGLATVTVMGTLFAAVFGGGVWWHQS